MDKANTKMILGAVLTGVGLLSGNAVLTTVAGGIGINWSSEALDDLVVQIGRSRIAADSPLEQAYRAALRRAISLLRDTYRRTVDSRSDGAAFKLLEDSIATIAQAQHSSGIQSPADAQQILDTLLPALLHGHDQRQVAFVQRHLLEAATVAFHAELANNHAAQTQYSTLLLQHLGGQAIRTHAAVAELPAILQQLQQSDVLVQALPASLTRIEVQIQALHDRMEQLRQPPSAADVPIFDIGSMKAKTIRNITGDMMRGTPPLGYTPSTPVTGRPAFRIGTAEADEIDNIAGTLYEEITGHTPPQAVLAVFTNPPDTTPLNLRGEAQLLHDVLAPVREQYALYLLPASTIDHLSRGLLNYRPTILHIAGHGTGDGLLFEDATPDGQLVPREALVRELALHAAYLHCVVLNACHSLTHTQTTLDLGVPYVVAMRDSISDPAAIEWARGFYEALAAGDSIPHAYEIGCNRIRLKNLAGAEIPVLWQHD